MRNWRTFGAFGDTVIELSLLDLIKLLCGKEIEVGAWVICFGRSRRKSLHQAPSREEQLKNIKRHERYL